MLPLEQVHELYGPPGKHDCRSRAPLSIRLTPPHWATSRPSQERSTRTRRRRRTKSERKRMATPAHPGGNDDLFNHPLALALESMRGENTFCLEPITSPTGRSDYGVRISLSNTGDSNTDGDILVYAQLDSATSDVFSSCLTPPSTSATTPQRICLLVVCILPGPPHLPVITRPRPDDPTPHVPTLPTPASAKRKRDASPAAPFSSAVLTGGEFANLSGDEKEKTNKMVVKHAIVRCLSDHSIMFRSKDTNALRTSRPVECVQIVPRRAAPLVNVSLPTQQHGPQMTHLN
ncbi:hypothetical protein FOMPIDRAFT_1056487, partial [Fomitopsis schrenkii]